MWANYDDVLAQLQACGLDVRELEVDTARPKRCHEVDGDREKRGWYWLTTKRIGDADYVTGAFGVYHGNDNGKQVVKINRDGKAVQIDKAEREAIAARQREHMKRLKALRQAEIDEIKARLEAATGKEVPKVQYSVGEEVKITDGAFANLTGRIDEIDPERGKLKISVSIFGRFTPVELEYWQVQRITE